MILIFLQDQDTQRAFLCETDCGVGNGTICETRESTFPLYLKSQLGVPALLTQRGVTMNQS